MVLFAIRCFFSGVRGTYETRRTVKSNRAIRPHIHRGQWSSENRSRIHRGKRGRPICAAHTNKRQNVRRQGGGPRRVYQMAGRRLVRLREISSRERGLQRRGIARCAAFRIDGGYILGINQNITDHRGNLEAIAISSGLFRTQRDAP